MKLTKEIAEIIRRKFIEQVKLTEAEATKWNKYILSEGRAAKRKAYAEAKPGAERIAIRQKTNVEFALACEAAIQAALSGREFWGKINQVVIDAIAAALLARIEKI